MAFLCYCLAPNKRVIAPKDDSALEVFETFFLCSVELIKLASSQCMDLRNSVSGQEYCSTFFELNLQLLLPTSKPSDARLARRQHYRAVREY